MKLVCDKCGYLWEPKGKVNEERLQVGKPDPFCPNKPPGTIVEVTPALEVWLANYRELKKDFDYRGRYINELREAISGKNREIERLNGELARQQATA